MAGGRAVRWVLIGLLVALAVACTSPSTSASDDETQTDGATAGQTDGDTTTGGDTTDDDDDGAATDEDVITDDDPPEVVAYNQAECDAGTGPCVDASSSDCESETACVVLLENQACHNFTTAGGKSDDRVFGRTFGVAPNSHVIGYFDVTDGLAPGAPAERTAGDFVHGDGSFIWVLPAHAPGEKLTLTAVTVEGVAVDVADFSTVIEPLDDPTTECEALPTE